MVQTRPFKCTQLYHTESFFTESIIIHCYVAPGDEQQSFVTSCLHLNVMILFIINFNYLIFNKDRNMFSLMTPNPLAFRDPISVVITLRYCNNLHHMSK